MKHTPGPWQCAYEGATVAFIVETDGTTVGKISVTENTTAHSHLVANTRLVAAAPELLAELESLVKANFGQPRGVTVPTLDNARRLIELFN